MTEQELAGLLLFGKDLGAVVEGEGSQAKRAAVRGEGKRCVWLCGQQHNQRGTRNPCPPAQQGTDLSSRKAGFGKWSWRKAGTSWRTSRMENLADKDGGALIASPKRRKKGEKRYFVSYYYSSSYKEEQLIPNGSDC